MIKHIQTPLILGYFIGFVLFFAPVLGFFAPKGLTPLVILGGLVGFLIMRFQQRIIEWPKTPLVIFLFIFCLWAFISVFWSIDVKSAFVGSGKLTGNFIVGVLLFAIFRSLNVAERQIGFRGLLYGFSLVLLLLVFEIYLKHPIYAVLKESVPSHYPDEFFWLNAAVVILCSLLWPLSLVGYKKSIENKTKNIMTLIIVCGFFAIMFLTILIGFSSGTIALIFGIIGASVIRIFGRRSAYFAAGVLVLIGLMLPFGFNNIKYNGLQITKLVKFNPSATHRIKIWQFTASKIDQKINVGWGLNASKHMPGGKGTVYSDGGQRYGQALPLHPHSAILQIWLELGLLGIILYLGLGVYIINSAVKPYRSKIESAMIFGQFSTLMVIANLSYGVWQAWWISVLWLSASLMFAALERPKTI